jgi:hypothetical protein
MRVLTTAALGLAGLLIALPDAPGQDLTAPSAPPNCGSVVIIKCDKPKLSPSERDRKDAARDIEARRTDRAAVEFDRVIIEGDAERPDTVQQAISHTLSRPLVVPGEHSFSIGESAQCTCRNICPPLPFPCCACTDRVGSSLANAPGWKPTN